jgi:ribonuclease-3
MFRARKFKELERKLGYKFKSQALIERALTHASLRGSKKAREDNERLEFVGDRVLGLAIVELLNEVYPSASEGELARHYNRLVKGETCAKVGRELGLGAYMKLSESEAESGGRHKATILADAVEAVLGAIFIDGGFNKARDVVRHLWHGQKGSEQRAAIADPKSALQEWAQGQGLALPRYVEVERTLRCSRPRCVSRVGRRPAARAPRNAQPSRRRPRRSSSARA